MDKKLSEYEWLNHLNTVEWHISPFLLGGHQPSDVIHEAMQKSWIDRQLRFELNSYL